MLLAHMASSVRGENLYGRRGEDDDNRGEGGEGGLVSYAAQASTEGCCCRCFGGAAATEARSSGLVPEADATICWAVTDRGGGGGGGAEKTQPPFLVG